jgi:hypothetical protein
VSGLICLFFLVSIIVTIIAIREDLEVARSIDETKRLIDEIDRRDKMR